jgi:hypothetical protein
VLSLSFSPRNTCSASKRKGKSPLLGKLRPLCQGIQLLNPCGHKSWTAGASPCLPAPDSHLARVSRGYPRRRNDNFTHGSPAKTVRLAFKFVPQRLSI